MINQILNTTVDEHGIIRINYIGYPDAPVSTQPVEDNDIITGIVLGPTLIKETIV